VAIIELTDLQSEKHISGHTKDLTLFGCFVETMTPFSEGTKVRLRISHGGMNLVAQGNVAYSRPNSGMGIAFIMIEQGSQGTPQGRPQASGRMPPDGQAIEFPARGAFTPRMGRIGPL
jgi:PilZ domain